ncbi:hypothetical protein KBD11_02415 [Candidatus Saccharibacteria bacterium]|nr:hypothetical protein [Candidatus Saccharibacteria bacterium]
MSEHFPVNNPRKWAALVAAGALAIGGCGGQDRSPSPDSRQTQSATEEIPEGYDIKRCFMVRQDGGFKDTSGGELEHAGGMNAFLQVISMRYLGVREKSIVGESVFGYGMTARTARATLTKKHQGKYDASHLPLGPDYIGFDIYQKKSGINDGAVIVAEESRTIPGPNPEERGSGPAWPAFAEVPCDSKPDILSGALAKDVFVIVRD